jgi:hypothetical protein
MSIEMIEVDHGKRLIHEHKLTLVDFPRQFFSQLAHSLSEQLLESVDFLLEGLSVLFKI